MLYRSFTAHRRKEQRERGILHPKKKRELKEQVREGRLLVCCEVGSERRGRNGLLRVELARRDEVERGREGVKASRVVRFVLVFHVLPISRFV